MDWVHSLDTELETGEREEQPELETLEEKAWDDADRAYDEANNNKKHYENLRNTSSNNKRTNDGRDDSRAIYYFPRQVHWLLQRQLQGANSRPRGSRSSRAGAKY